MTVTAITASAARGTSANRSIVVSASGASTAAMKTSVAPKRAAGATSAGRMASAAPSAAAAAATGIAMAAVVPVVRNATAAATAPRPRMVTRSGTVSAVDCDAR
ncbi:hypothetical protein GCM10025876_10320 [Demequina litorisediminis]|uniref:Uncharacterized protein n=1 Tax=Demequina litorisediminis TaxID=1849022 RepID=A0ABQ6ICL1_9MICO|nr:hypothetical protein GCM10025876_10320 [Demequina litorisediminis]